MVKSNLTDEVENKGCDKEDVKSEVFPMPRNI